MSQKPMPNQIRAAKVLLIIVLLLIATDIGTFFQTEYQLVSPLIPKGIIVEISRPYLFASLISVTAVIAALIFYFFSRYLFTIVICGVALVWHFYYLNWGAYL
jgi:hypothetical protein